MCYCIIELSVCEYKTHSKRKIYMLDTGTGTNVVCFRRVFPSRIDALGCIRVRHTTNILTLCKKMSVGHICNVVLGGLENVCTE